MPHWLWLKSSGAATAPLVGILVLVDVSTTRRSSPVENELNVTRISDLAPYEPYQLQIGIMSGYPGRMLNDDEFNSSKTRFNKLVHAGLTVSGTLRDRAFRQKLFRSLTHRCPIHSVRMAVFHWTRYNHTWGSGSEVTSGWYFSILYNTMVVTYICPYEYCIHFENVYEKQENEDSW